MLLSLHRLFGVSVVITGDINGSGSIEGVAAIVMSFVFFSQGCYN